MTIWRGEGGGGDATTDSEINFITSLTNSIVDNTAITTAAADATAALYDSFDDRYLGSKAVAPTLDNDSNALISGALYWNSVSNQMFVWSGVAWQQTFFSGTNVRSVVTATAGQTVVTTPSYTQGNNTIQVYVNGFKVISGTDYTETSTTSITFASGLTLGDEVEILIAQPFSVGITSSDAVNYLPVGTGAVATTVQTKLRESVSVKDFGAKGDGVTDDSVAINAAFLSGGSCVIFPPGTYSIGTQLLLSNNDVSVVGVGFPVLKTANSVATAFTLVRLRGSRVTIEGIIFEGNNAAPAISGRNSALALDTNSGTLSNVAVRNCTFQNYAGYGVTSFNAGTLTGVEFENCRFNSFTSVTATPEGVIQIVTPDTSNVRVSGCSFSEINGVAVGVRSQNGAAAASNVSVVGCVFNHNVFTYTSIGVEVWNANNLAVSGNTFSNARMGLSIFGEQIAISGNTFDNHTSYCIEGGNSDGLAISGNSFRNFTYGMILYDGADDVAVTGNTFRDAASGSTSALNLGWAMQTSGTGLSEDYNRIIFSANTLLNCSGVRIERCAGINIADNIFETTSTDNQNTVLLSNAECKNAQVVNNLFRTSVDRGGTSSGYISINGENISVFGNSITSTTAAVNVGCGIINTSGATISDSLIENNYIENFTNGVTVNAGSPTLSNLTISANRFVSVTTTLLTAAGVILMDRVSADISDIGDVNATLNARSRRINRFTVALTANRTVTLETTDAYRGQTFRVVRIASGASTLSVGGIKTLLQNEWVEVTYTGSTWVVTASGSLTPRVLSGVGTPEAVVAAPVGTLFTRSDGGASTTLYVKESGTGNTGWVAK